ncbi:MAG: neocarzinostatin apoprotein domain-containing protein [Acidimicrobiia bacterium]|nr:neocarzinostatin apoprotein domain-containing protein [Acidimicrobiia bacterium]MDH5237010.1 neocarzinostatin apoprotein domain-containing protein [Acidimicrobiia bacterium]
MHARPPLPRPALHRLAIGATLAVLLLMGFVVPVSAQRTPSISVEPSRNIEDQAALRVAIAGFAPHQLVAIGQCTAGAAVSGNVFDCAVATARGVVTSGNGRASTTIVGSRFMHINGAWVDCGIAGECVVGAAVLDAGFQVLETAWQPVVFAYDPSIAPLEMGIDVEKVTIWSIRGTVTCSNPATVAVRASLLQGDPYAGGPAASASGDTIVACDGSAAFEVPLVFRSGRFLADLAFHSVGAIGDDGRFTAESNTGAIDEVGRDHTPRRARNWPGTTMAVTDVTVAGADDSATATITIRCAEPARVRVAVTVQQFFGTHSAVAEGEIEVRCRRSMEVEVPVAARGSVLRPGRATAWVNLRQAGAHPSDAAALSRTIRLIDRIRPPNLIVSPDPTSALTIGRAVDGAVRVRFDCGADEVTVGLSIEATRQQGRRARSVPGEKLGPCQGPTLFRVGLPGARPGDRLVVEVDAWVSAGGPFGPGVLTDHQEAGRRMH